MKFEGIDFGGQAFLASSKVFAKDDFETRERVVDRNGNFFWQIPVAVASERELESFVVTVPSRENPVEELDVMSPLKFDDLSLSVGIMNGRKYFAFRAAGVARA